MIVAVVETAAAMPPMMFRQSEHAVDRAHRAADTRTDRATDHCADRAGIATTDLAKEMVIHKDDAAHAAQTAAQAHGLASAKAQHDATMDVAEHALDVHQVMNPPPSGDSGE